MSYDPTPEEQQQEHDTPIEAWRLGSRGRYIRHEGRHYQIERIVLAGEGQAQVHVMPCVTVFPAPELVPQPGVEIVRIT